MYVTDVTSGTTEKKGTPQILKQTVATALVDGNNILGNLPITARRQLPVWRLFLADVHILIKLQKAAQFYLSSANEVAI